MIGSLIKSSVLEFSRRFSVLDRTMKLRQRSTVPSFITVMSLLCRVKASLLLGQTTLGWQILTTYSLQPSNISVLFMKRTFAQMSREILASKVALVH